MRIARVEDEGGTRLAVERDGDLLVAPDAPATLNELLASGPGTAPLEHGLREPEGTARLLAPLVPGKVVAIGLNYLDHIRETGMERPTRPLIFAKFPSSVIGPGQPIVVDRNVCERADWEVELTAVVGRRLRNVSEEEALAGVFGYTIGNDVSGRDAQFGDVQWVRGKSFDTFCPLGPVVVTADEIPDPQSLALSTSVNGELVQDSSTAEMLFGVAELLAYCARSFTLEPGDVLLTGTPWGCGEFMEPKRSLQDGDTVECRIEGIGRLANPVREVAAG
jgi:2-keto-4-pentenoate hydratase/2-oxohepta-3-ene-1,7-dioic acid hydratase in catechol pathway